MGVLFRTTREPLPSCAIGPSIRPDMARRRTQNPAARKRPRVRDASARRIERLESLLARHSASNARLIRLANFPEQNPDILVELDASARVTYLNPVAEARFPELRTQGYAHPLL